MPENTLSVTRPGKWGNMFVVGRPLSGAAGLTFDVMYAFGDFRECPSCLDNLDWLTYGIRGHAIQSAEAASRLFRQYCEWKKATNPDSFRKWIAPLRGKNLACFCPISQPCHADVLLEIANEKI